MRILRSFDRGDAPMSESESGDFGEADHDFSGIEIPGSIDDSVETKPDDNGESVTVEQSGNGADTFGKDRWQAGDSDASESSAEPEDTTAPGDQETGVLEVQDVDVGLLIDWLFGDVQVHLIDGQLIEWLFGDAKEQLLEYVGPHWSDIREDYESADNRNEKRSARAAAVKRLEREFDWMSVTEWSDERRPELWFYDEQKGWREDGYKILKGKLVEKIGVHAEEAECNHIRQQLAAKNYVSMDELDAADDPRHLVPFANGVLVIDSIELDDDGHMKPGSWELIENDPGFHFTFRLDAEWDPENADFDPIDSFMQDITSSEVGRTDQRTDIKTLWEFAGHSFFMEYEPSGMLLGHGDGADGKSLMTDVWTAVLGRDNISATPMSKINTNRFSSSRVVRKLANIGGDIGGSLLKDVSLLKALTGGDLQEVEPKHKQAYDAENRATFCFFGNEMPPFKEKSGAVKRRVYPVEFPFQFKHDPDPDDPFEKQKVSKREMHGKLLADDVLSAAAVRMAEGAKRLLEQDEWSLGLELEPEERMELYEKSADPIADFSRRCLKYDPQGPGVEIDDLKSTYDRFSEEMNHPEKGKKLLGRELNRLNEVDTSKSKPRSWSSGDDRDTVYENLAFTETAKQNYVPQHAHWDKYGGKPERFKDDSDVDRMAKVAPGDEGVVLEGTVIHAADDIAVLTVEDDSDRPLQVSESCGEADPAEYDWRLDSVREGDVVRIEGDVGRDERGIPQVWVEPFHDAEIVDEAEIDIEEELDELTQKKGLSATRSAIRDLDDETEAPGAPVDEVVERVAERENCRKARVEYWLKEKLAQRGEVYERQTGRYQLTS